MNWTAFAAISTLLFVQAGFVGACLYAYNRIRSQQDSAGQEKLNWGVKIEAAFTQADTARKVAESMEVTHFKALRNLVEGYAAELSDARARIVSVEKELKVCQMKLASEERISRRDEARAAKRNGVEVPAAPEPADVDSPASLPGAIPLRVHQAEPAATAPARSNFGRVR